jgi:hypothetical protein
VRVARTAVRWLAIAVSGAVLAGCSGAHAVPQSAASASRGGLSPAGFDVAAENAKPGTTAWTIAPSAIGPQEAIEGYADRISVAAGEPFRLYVSTTAPSFTATAYRIGYYGGTGARQIWQSANTHGRRQTAQTIDPATHAVTCEWSPSLSVATDGWPEGDYLIKLVAAQGAGARYVPITVRSTVAAGRTVLVADVTTWQAYNGWGGYSLYGGPRGHGDRARAVSFDRPYFDYDQRVGDGLFMPFDQDEVTFAEQHGLPVAYATDLELETQPELFKGAADIVTGGHDEYYSLQMRTTLTAARDAGTNLAFLGANAVYRHIRWAPTRLGGDRLIICYKEAPTDPLYATDQTQTTQNWRDAPDPRPENALTGAYFQCDPAAAAYVVYDPGVWIFAGTGVAKGASFPGLVWPEYDRVVDTPTTPHPIQVLSHSPLTCSGHASYQESSYYTTPSGAGVFDAGTMQWECALGTHCTVPVAPAVQAFVQAATLNLLRVFAAGPAGRTHPALDNTAADAPPTTIALTGAGS